VRTRRLEDRCEESRCFRPKPVTKVSVWEATLFPAISLSPRPNPLASLGKFWKKHNLDSPASYHPKGPALTGVLLAGRLTLVTSESGGNRGKIALMTGHVLLVEDDDAVREVIARHLEMNGMIVHQASSASEAMQLLERENYFALILDRLVASAGLRVSRAFRERKPHAPIILITGYSTSHTELEARASGVDLVLLKPIRLPHLMAELERLAAPPMAK